MRVEWSEEARSDLREIQASASDGDDLVERLIRRADQLPEFPRAGAVVERYRRARVRWVLVGRYRLLYVVGRRTITVVGVAHGAREL